MPRHLAMDINYLQGTVYFNNTKSAVIYFLNEKGQQVYFSKAPKVMLTPSDSTTMPAFRQEYIKQNNLYVGVIIRMNTVWTGHMDWIVLEGI